jgi:cytochrome c biogenesis protein CcmG/thiol:disulfide interchange protein DsbE
MALTRSQKVFIGGGLAALALPVALFAWAFIAQVDPSRIDSPLIDAPAPPFELPRLADDAPVSLQSFTGKPVVVNFWATWCASCPMEHPVLLQAARRYEGRVQFVGIAYEDKKPRLQGWLDRNGGEAFPTLVDVGGKAAIAYGVYGVPETYVIDAKGVIRYKHTGPISPTTLMEQVDAVL